MPRFAFVPRNRLGLPALDHALLVAVVALLLLGLSPQVRAGLTVLAGHATVAATALSP